MAYRQKPQGDKKSQFTSAGSAPRPTHGNQCACAVCTDLNSMNESACTPRGRPGSVAGQSLQSGHQSQSKTPFGCQPNGSVGQPSQASGRTVGQPSQASGRTVGQPSQASGRTVGQPSQASGRTVGQPSQASCRTEDRSARSSKRAVTKSPGPSAGAQTLSSECLTPPRQEDRDRASMVSPPASCEPVCRDAGGRESPGGGRGICRDRPKSAGKNKSRRTPSGSRGKGGKGGAGGGGGRDGEGSKGGQKPRPLCISEGKYGDKGSAGLDECDFDEDEIISPELPSGDVPEGQPEATSGQIVAELDGRDAASCLRQPSDGSPLAPAPMGPLGPWAVGKPDWTPLGGLTGTRPIVDRYTITRYSLPEWHQRNLATFRRAAQDTNRASLVAFNTRSCIGESLTAAENNQKGVTQSLQQRNADVRRWLPELHGSHEELWREIKALSSEDDRLRRILCVLETIAQLVGESIQLRTTRMEQDLTHDEVDEELTRELGLVNEIKQLLQRTRDELRKQVDSSRSAKHRLEQDIADKETTTRIDCTNTHLRVDSPTIMFSESAARFMDNQSTPATWEAFSRENLNISATEMSKIRSLRALIESVVKDTGRDLLAQKAKTEDTLARHITLIASVIEDLQNQLNLVLRGIVETEQLIKEIKEALRKLDFPLKEAQTRLRNRQDRPRNENTRDCPQYALVDELKSIGEQATALIAQLNPAENALQALFASRMHLETELQSKKKNLIIDRDRILRLRQSYPPTEAIMAHAYSQCLPCR